VMQRTTCETQGETRIHQRYFISSKKGASHADAQEWLEAIRGHWSVENNGHWVLDVMFGEDKNQVRSRRGAHNLSLVRKMAMNMLRRETKTPKRVSRKRRMLRCLLSADYREHILSLVAISPDSMP
jgi:predicted transposase YbfD/YdcC